MKNFKRFIVILLVAMLATGSVVFAADSSVSYEGQAEKFIFKPGSRHSPTDLFDNFKGVMPGDTVTQKIYIKNNAKDEIKIKLYMRSKGAQKGTEDFLKNLNLSVTQDGNSKLFAAPADQTADLTDWVYLGTIYSGGKITLDVELEIPIELGNEFQNAIGYIDWEFKVEELPKEPDDPQTSDDFNIAYYIFAVCVCLSIIWFILARKKKEEQDKV